jgi:hypothetical protein
MKDSIKQFIYIFITATAAFFNKGKSGRVSKDWKTDELWRYEDDDRKARGLYQP